jgi:antitoxin CptB
MSERSKFLWRCRRGVKELDVVFTQFFESNYDQLTAVEMNAFERLLDMEDPEILSMMLKQSESEDKEIAELIKRIRNTN